MSDSHETFIVQLNPVEPRSNCFLHLQDDMRIERMPQAPMKHKTLFPKTKPAVQEQQRSGCSYLR